MVRKTIGILVNDQEGCLRYEGQIREVLVGFTGDDLCPKLNIRVNDKDYVFTMGIKQITDICAYSLNIYQIYDLLSELVEKYHGSIGSMLFHALVVDKILIEIIKLDDNKCKVRLTSVNTKEFVETNTCSSYGLIIS